MDKAALLAPRLKERDVEIPGVGTVRVRALTRAEANRLDSLNGPEVERMVLHLGLVDPQMSLEDIDEWMKVAPAGEVNPIAQAIGELSGLLEGSAKAIYKSDGPEPEPGV